MSLHFRHLYTYYNERKKKQNENMTNVQLKSRKLKNKELEYSVIIPNPGVNDVKSHGSDHSLVDQ